MKTVNTIISRREFVRRMSTGVAGVTLPLALSSCTQENPSDIVEQPKKTPVGTRTGGDGSSGHNSHHTNADLIPRRPLGKTGLEVSMLAFGGGSQFLKNKDGEWEPLLEKALELGINYFDTSHGYAGSEERFAEILAPVRDQIIITTKFDARTASGMRTEFEKSLKRLKTDYVDILMIHSVENKDSVSNIENGVYKEMLKLKDEGSIRFLGFSSMNSASKSKELLDNLDFDVVMLAMNPTNYGNFAQVALPSALKKNVGVLAMKVMRDIVGETATAEELLHYALDKEGVCSAVVGHFGMNILEENAELVKKIGSTSSVPNWHGLEQRLKPFAGPHALCWARDDYFDGKLV